MLRYGHSAVRFGLTTAGAQTYPDKTIKFIVPYTPGSPVDAGARVIAQDLQKRLGQSVILEARSGAGNATGTKAAAVAAPDGYTLLLTGTPLVFSPPCIRTPAARWSKTSCRSHRS